MSADWFGVGVLPTPLGSLAFRVTARGIASVRLGYPNLKAAVEAILPEPRGNRTRSDGAFLGSDTIRQRLGPLLWIAPGAHLKPPEFASALADDFTRYFGGEVVDFAGYPLDFGTATSFQLQVWQTCRSIPFGETMSYAQLAARMGRPSAARAVGRALGANSVPLIVPCHRVIAADGSLRGFSGYGGSGTKRALLELERTAMRKAAPPR